MTLSFLTDINYETKNCDIDNTPMLIQSGTNKTSNNDYPNNIYNSLYYKEELVHIFGNSQNIDPKKIKTYYHNIDTYDPSFYDKYGPYIIITPYIYYLFPFRNPYIKNIGYFINSDDCWNYHGNDNEYFTVNSY